MLIFGHNIFHICLHLPHQILRTQSKYPKRLKQWAGKEYSRRRLFLKQELRQCNHLYFKCHFWHSPKSFSSYCKQHEFSQARKNHLELGIWLGVFKSSTTATCCQSLKCCKPRHVRISFGMFMILFHTLSNLSSSSFLFGCSSYLDLGA